MRLLIDSCVWKPAGEALAADGHDVAFIADLASDPGDDAIMARAIDEQRVLITQDKDFGELAVRGALSHFGILRLVGFSSRRQAGVCRLALAHYESELAQGAIVTVELGRVRVRLEPKP